MAIMDIIKRPFRSFDGTKWVKHYFETSADQVKYAKKDGTESNVQTELTELNGKIPTKYAGSESLGGSAVDSDKLDGYHGSINQAANTYVCRDANGHTYHNYINSNTSNSENPATVSQVIVTNGDNFFRKASLQHLKNVLGLGTFTLGKSVPANAVFTDTKVIREVTNVNFHNAGTKGYGYVYKAGCVLIGAYTIAGNDTYVTHYTKEDQDLGSYVVWINVGGERNIPAELAWMPCT